MKPNLAFKKEMFWVTNIYVWKRDVFNQHKILVAKNIFYDKVQ